MALNEPRAPQIAVLGASGVGRFHARELAQAGAEVVAVLGSSRASAAEAAARLERELGIRARPFHALDEVLALDLDGVTVALPHELHFEATVRALSRGLYVFCEKPLVWEAGLTAERARPLLAELAAAGAESRLTVNTSNASFVAALRELGLLPQRPRRFRFHLRTAGDDEFEEIAVDLLPHALSLVRELLEPDGRAHGGPPVEIAGISARSEHHRFTAGFRAGDLAVSLELEEHPGHAKHMAFAIDDLEVRRVQGEIDGRYRVQLDVGSAVHEVRDPFAAYLAAFVAHLRESEPQVAFTAPQELPQRPYPAPAKARSTTRLPVAFDTAARSLLDLLHIVEVARADTARRGG